MLTTMGSGKTGKNVPTYERDKFREVILYSTVISGKEAGLLFEFLASMYLIKVQIFTIFFPSSIRDNLLFEIVFNSRIYGT